MHFTEVERERLLGFVGYGHLNAPIWFLGMEEGTAGDDEASIAANIRMRSRHFEQVIPLEVPEQYRTQTWSWMAKFARALLGREDWQDRQPAREYVRTRLGKPDGDTLLGDLLPLPKRNTSDWPEAYRVLFPTRKTYEQVILPKRLALWRRLIREHQPRYILAYGERNWEQYRQAVDAGRWTQLPDTTVEVARADNTLVALMPFFGNGRLGWPDAIRTVEYLRKRK